MPGSKSAATVTRPLSGLLSEVVSMAGGPSMTWSMPAAIRSPLARVECTSTARVPLWKEYSETSGEARAAAARGSPLVIVIGRGSLATNSDCTTTLAGASSASTS